MDPRQYSDSLHVRRHIPPRQSDHREYRNCLRLEFEFRCVYCLSLEAEVGPGCAFGGFEVEHFRPEKPFTYLRTVYSNLFWSCAACNRAKSNKWPTAAEEKAGYGFVNPTEVPAGKHMQIAGEKVVAVAGSAAGQYTIDTINLNSSLHKRRRARRTAKVKKLMTLLVLLDKQQETIKKLGPGQPGEFLLANLAETRKAVLDLWDELGGQSAPSDAPSACLCPKETNTQARGTEGA